MNPFEQTIEQQRRALTVQLEWSMTTLARSCAPVWHNKPMLDRVLAQGVTTMPLCRRLCATDTGGMQVSAAFMPDGMSNAGYGKNLASPFLSSALPSKGFLLSDVHVSEITQHPCITAVQVVSGKAGVMGFIAADFDLRDMALPQSQASEQGTGWLQVRGDPAIRESLFLQQRTKSRMDECSDDVIAIFDELICERGVFHVKLHYSSARATLWLVDDPYRYRIHLVDEIIDPSVCLAYPRRPYTDLATIPASFVRPVLQRFRDLREADETIYLRSGSLNIVNGMVSLTFSCDGSHYMSAAEFLEKGEAFWFGTVS